jgi:hypothetical protein
MPAKKYRPRRIAGQQRRHQTDRVKMVRADGVEQNYHVARSDPSKVRFVDTSLAPVGVPQPVRLNDPLPPTRINSNAALWIGLLGGAGIAAVAAFPFVGGLLGNVGILGGATTFAVMIAAATHGAVRKRLDDERRMTVIHHDAYIDQSLHPALMRNGFDLDRTQQRALLTGQRIAIDPEQNTHEATHLIRRGDTIVWERNPVSKKSTPPATDSEQPERIAA